MLHDILAGVVSGLFLSTIVLADGVFLLLSIRDAHERLSRILPTPFTPVIFMISVVAGIPVVCAILGAVCGVIYNIIRDSSESGWGSPNLVFTLAILVIAALCGIAGLLTRKKLVILPVLITSIAFAVIFGWILPLLANWR